MLLFQTVTAFLLRKSSCPVDSDLNTVTLQKHGNSHALVIDKALMEALGIDYLLRPHPSGLAGISGSRSVPSASATRLM